MKRTFARSTIALCSAALALAGCATASKDITAVYVSPNQYASYDCEQLAAEAARIQARVVQLGGRLDQAAQNDAGIMAIGLIIFWPALFALGGTKQQEAEYGRLKGEYDAVEQATIIKKCARTATPIQIAGAQAAAQTASSPASTNQTSPSATATVAMDTTGSAASTSPANLGTYGATPATTSSGKGSASPAIASPTPATSKYMISAERFAKDKGCETESSTMNIATANYETFVIACAKGEPLLIRCDLGTCREMK